MFYLHQSYPPGFPLKAAMGNQPRKKESHSVLCCIYSKTNRKILRHEGENATIRVWLIQRNEFDAVVQIYGDF